MSYINLPDSIKLENAEIRMNTRNFAGVPNPYGDATPNFCVWIPEALAPRLAEEGWNVKMARPRDENEAPRPYLPVTVKFNAERPHLNPVIYKYTTRNRIQITEGNLASLDRDTFKAVDMIIRPRLWKDKAGNPKGIKAYLHEMHVTIEESPFAHKYAQYDAPMVDEEDPF